MGYGNKTLAGSILFVGGILYVLGTIIGEKFGKESLVYNVPVLLLGLFMIASTYYIQRAFKSTLFSGSLALAGIGTVGVGLLGYLMFDATFYYVFAGIGYVFFGLSAIISYKFERSPLSYFSVLLGVVAFTALLLWPLGIELVAGVKATPIIVDFAIVLWLIGFGAHIIGE
jgi:hypothetical membrane protein